MSSILRALKKLEKDTPPRDSGISVKQVVVRRSATPRLISRILSIAMAVLMVGTAAWIFLNLSRKYPPSIQPDTPPGKPSITTVSTQTSPQQAPPSEKESEKAPAQVSPVTSVAPTDTDENPDRSAAPVSGSGPSRLPPRPGWPGSGPSPQPGSPSPQLVLNGILWSDNPLRRVALINDRYLKEGDSIDGATVVKIELKTVTLRSGEKTWNLNLKK